MKQAIKHPIQPGDPVVVLSEYHLLRGTCVRINAKSLTVDLPAQQSLIAHKMHAKKEKTAHQNDICAVVWESSRGPRGSYRLDYDNYPTHNKPVTEWHSPDFVEEAAQRLMDLS